MTLEVLYLSSDPKTKKWECLYSNNFCFRLYSERCSRKLISTTSGYTQFILFKKQYKLLQLPVPAAFVVIELAYVIRKFAESL